jgi:hypothetical protein
MSRLTLVPLGLKEARDFSGVDWLTRTWWRLFGVPPLRYSTCCNAPICKSSNPFITLVYCSRCGR